MEEAAKGTESCKGSATEIGDKPGKPGSFVQILTEHLLRASILPDVRNVSVHGALLLRNLHSRGIPETRGRGLSQNQGPLPGQVG